jgi:transcriptional regulator with XRE-family HTH domain
VHRAVRSTAETSFASLLKRYRGASHLTQESLAERAGSSREAVSALERGERLHPRADTADLLMKALGLGQVEHRAPLHAAKPRPRSRVTHPQSTFVTLLLRRRRYLAVHAK